MQQAQPDAFPYPAEDLLSWLQRWYSAYSDGYWEEVYGVSITTLDNPGWGVKIDLIGTSLEGQPYRGLERETSEADWVVCRVRENIFEGAGGPQNLRSILEAFQDWADGASP